MVKNLRRMLSNFKLISLLILFCFCVKKQDDIIIYKPSFKGDFFNEEKIICNYTRFDEIKMSFFSNDGIPTSSFVKIDLKEIKPFYSYTSQAFGPICKFHDKYYLFNKKDIINSQDFEDDISDLGYLVPDSIFHKKIEDRNFYYFTSGVKDRNLFLIVVFIENKGKIHLNCFLSEYYLNDKIGDFDKNGKIDVLIGKKMGYVTDSIKIEGYEFDFKSFVKNEKNIRIVHTNGINW